MRSSRTGLILSLAALSAPLSAEEGVRANPVGAKGAGAAAAWEITRLQGPEGAFFDVPSRSVFIANSGGNTATKDGKGWITRADIAGKVVEERWLEGLNAPRGMRSYRGKLYVADLDELIEVSAKTGKILRRLAAPEAKVLHDVAVDFWGNIYASDAATGRVYLFTPKGKASVFAEGSELGSPRGLAIHQGKLYVAAGVLGGEGSARTPGRLLAIDLRTKAVDAVTGPLGDLDGLQLFKDGWLVSDISAGKILRIRKDGKAKTVLYGLPGSADIDFVPSRNLLIVARSKENAVSAYNAGKLPLK